MINLNRTPKKQIGSRNGLKIFSKLHSKSSGLKAKKQINKISKKQAERNKLWSEITNQKIELTGHRCQWCGKLGQRTGTDNFLSGHHILKRRYHVDTLDCCYIAHWITCHQFIETHNIDVRKYKTKAEWEKRNET